MVCGVQRASNPSPNDLKRSCQAFLNFPARMQASPQAPEVLRQALRKAFKAPGAMNRPIRRLSSLVSYPFQLRNTPFRPLSNPFWRHRTAISLPFHSISLALATCLEEQRLLLAVREVGAAQQRGHALQRRLRLLPGQPVEPRQLRAEAPVVLGAQAAARRVQPAAQAKLPSLI